MMMIIIPSLQLRLTLAIEHYLFRIAPPVLVHLLNELWWRQLHWVTTMQLLHLSVGEYVPSLVDVLVLMLIL